MIKIVKSRDMIWMTKTFKKINSNLNITLHNYANNDEPCAGIYRGNTQEEQIFKQSNIHKYLTADLYPIDKGNNLGCIYSNGVLFNDIKLNVVSIAALKVPRHKSLIIGNKHVYDYLYDEQKQIMSKKIHKLLRTCKNNGTDVLVTGLWGLGVFCNPIWGLTQIWNDCIKNSGIPIIIFVVQNDDRSKLFKEYIETT